VPEPSLNWPLADRLDIEERLIEAYSAGRGYHDLRHLTEVLGRLDELGAGGDAELVLAAWFHDAVYAGADDDEELSAQWAERALPAEYADEVARLVRMTVHHRPADDDPAGCALSDADLGILAAPPERYAAYAAGVRADFAHVGDDDFRAGRAAVLADLAAKPYLFHTAQGRQLWEEQARANLAVELEELRRG
jgi:predicted metal-dependent HD superfamily phosphohydrolase